MDSIIHITHRYNFLKWYEEERKKGNIDWFLQVMPFIYCMNYVTILTYAVVKFRKRFLRMQKMTFSSTHRQSHRFV
uniref:Very-long-chain 3-oxoacyl-CoA synthase n=1 Tax=Acrobeloides nanus TaxID=290746 RepID=A0A914DUY7_9BILA